MNPPAPLLVPVERLCGRPDPRCPACRAPLRRGDELEVLDFPWAVLEPQGLVAWHARESCAASQIVKSVLTRAQGAQPFLAVLSS